MIQYRRNGAVQPHPVDGPAVRRAKAEAEMMGTPTYHVVGNRDDYMWTLRMVAALWDGPSWIMDPASTLETAIGFNEIFCPMMVTVRWVQ